MTSAINSGKINSDHIILTYVKEWLADHGRPSARVYSKATHTERDKILSDVILYDVVLYVGNYKIYVHDYNATNTTLRIIHMNYNLKNEFARSTFNINLSNPDSLESLLHLI